MLVEFELQRENFPNKNFRTYPNMKGCIELKDNLYEVKVKSNDNIIYKDIIKKTDPSYNIIKTIFEEMYENANNQFSTNIHVDL